MAEGMGFVVIGVAVGFALVAADPAFRRVVGIDGQGVIAEFAAGSECAFRVAWQTIMTAGLARQPRRVGLGGFAEPP